MEAHRASLEDGQNFHVEVLATFGGQGYLAEGVRKLLEPKRSGQGACDHWFSASLGEALESIRQAIDNDQHACEMQASISNTNADIAASVPANPAWFSKKARARIRLLRASMKRRRETSAMDVLRGDALCVMQNSRIQGEVKVGRSMNVNKRRQGLQGCHNFRMLIHAVFPGRGYLEKHVHAALEAQRVKNMPGKEWFYGMSSMAISAISSAIANQKASEN